MLMTALVPFIGGAVLSRLHIRSAKLRLVLSEALTIATSLLILRLLICGEKSQVLLRYNYPLTITFGLDGAGKLFLALIAFLWPLAILYTNEYMEHEERPDSFNGFYIMTFGVMVLFCCAQSLFTMYIAYELLTMVTLPLVWHKKDRDSIHAARDYVCYSIGAAAMGFIAMIIITYYDGGAFVFQGTALDGMPMTAMQIAYLLCFFGLGVKAAVFPLSAWLPRACAAPTPVTALLHAVAVVNSGIFAILRVTYYVFDINVLRGTTAQHIALIAAICTVLYGAIMAVRIRHVKRKLAFSTISNLGYMMFGIALMTSDGMNGAMVHMVNHSLMKILLFFCIGAVMCKTERSMMPEMRGLARVMPFTFCVFVFGAIALIGIPPLCGFVSKYYLLTAATAEGSPLAIVGMCALMISSVLAAIYSLSVTIPAFTMPLENADQLPRMKCDPSWRMVLPLIVLMVAIIAIGIQPQFLYRIISTVGEVGKGVR